MKRRVIASENAQIGTPYSRVGLVAVGEWIYRLGLARAKYHALTPMGGLSQHKIDQSLDIVQRFEEASSVSALTDLLRV
jgi:hypothetical protein